MCAAEKLLAEWFWIDRWMGSSGFLLPMEPRGLYREMLTQSWRRGARLPNDHEAIRRAVGCTKREWLRCWPQLERYWRVDGDSLVNDTQLEVYAAAKAQQDRASARGKAGAQARAQALAQAKLKQVLEDKPPSPSPSPRERKRKTEPSVGALAPRGKGGHPTWLSGYGEDWKARWGIASEPPYGEMAGAFHEAHELHGEPKLRPAWQGFLASVERAMYARPARFVQELGQWLGPRPVGVPARAAPRQTASDRTSAAVARFIARRAVVDAEVVEGGSGSGDREGPATDRGGDEG